MHLFIGFFLLFLGHIEPEDTYSISGTIADSETNEGIPFVYLHLEEIRRSAVADAFGNYTINNVPEGEYTLTIHHIGYKTKNQTITVTSNEDVQRIDITLQPSIFSSQAIEVSGDQNGTTGSNIEHASQKFFGSDLRRDLSGTLAQTLSNLPGFDQRTMGGTPGRPVIRGLGDERVVILQDGIASGDVSAQSGDHAVVIDPISALEVEIARGPAALEFGSNAIGGVINVVKNQIATSIPSRITGIFTANGESVNTAASGALNLTIPRNNLVLNLDLNGRTASNTNTPLGELKNTELSSTNSSIGLSWIHEKGYVGGSFSTFISNYGIPPDPNGHPSGVDIELENFQYVLKSEYIFENEFLRTLEADFSLNDYFHVEFESSGSVGTEFSLVTASSNIVLGHNEIGFIDGGRIGIDFQTQDYSVFGASTSPSNSYSVAAFVIEEAGFGAVQLEAGLRFDWVRNAPDEDDPDSRIGNIRARNFAALSSSFSGVYNFNPQLSVGLSVLHSFRAPSLEELYSEGPHLASFNYEIGNPDLDPERGLAKELFLRFNGNTTFFELTGFHNGFSNYLYLQNTGRRNFRFPDLNDFQFVGNEVVLYGFELSAEQKVVKNVLLDASLSYTIGERDSTITTGGNSETVQRPLAQIPPFKANVAIKYATTSYEFGSRVRYSAEQDRTGEFETPTDSFTLVDLFAQYRFTSGKLLHSISLNVSNLLDETHYNHLSLIKDIQPEPGRNISLLYRLYF